MSSTQAIPVTTRTGTQTINFAAVPPGTQWAQVTIQRDVTPGGLNTLATTETLTISVDRSTDGGVTWKNAAATTALGGTYVTKGVTQVQERLTVGIDPEDTGYRITTTASTSVRISGQVDYTP